MFFLLVYSWTTILGLPNVFFFFFALLEVFAYLFIWLHQVLFVTCKTFLVVAYRILVPWPEIEPRLPPLGTQSLNHWTTRKWNHSVVSDSLQPQAPPSMEFSRQEYWNGLPFPSPGDLPNPGIEPRSPALQADALPSELLGKANNSLTGLNLYP